MHIGFDAKRFFHNATGLGNYARTTISGLAETFPEHRYILFDAQGTSPLCNAPQHQALLVQDACLAGKSCPALWRSLGIPWAAKQHDLDIYHGLSHELPLTPFARHTKTVVTMHDLIFLTHPHLYPWLDGALYRFKYALSCRRADMIVAISQKTAADVHELFHIPWDRIRVAYQSCAPRFYAPADENTIQTLRSRYALPQEYVLFVGSLIKRKGCDTLIQALGMLAERPPLLLVGTGPEQTSLQQMAHEAGVDAHFLGRVPTEDLPGLYQTASLFAYPSFSEGFGIPILEALFSRTPVITSTGSCFSEPGGKAALYTTPGDAPALAESITRVLTDSTLRQSMIEHGERHARTFHITNTSAALMAVYTELGS